MTGFLKDTINPAIIQYTKNLPSAGKKDRNVKDLPIEKPDKIYRMAHDPVEKLAAGRTVPVILTMLITNLYSMAERAAPGSAGRSPA